MSNTKQVRMRSLYKEADFDEDDASSVGSTAHFTDVTSTPLHVRYVAAPSSIWRSRSLLEQLLLILLGIVSIVVFVLSLIIAYSSPNHSVRVMQIGSHPHDSFCLTADCIQTAAYMLESANLSVDPCDDFYEFACGKWERENPLPNGRYIYGTFGKLEEQNYLTVKKLLENSSLVFPSLAEKKARMYYESCMDRNNTMEKIGATPLLKLIEEVGGWNITKGYNVSQWSLIDDLKILQLKYSMPAFFSWVVGENDKNSSSYVIDIDQDGLVLPSRSYYLNTTANKEVIKAYLDYMTKVGVLLGGEENDTRRQMEAIFQFETEIANFTVPREDLRGAEKTYNPMTLAELRIRAPFISWQEYFTEAMKPVEREITWDEKVIVFVPEFMEKMSDLITRTIKTDDGKILIHNYLVWHTARNLVSCLSKAFRDAYNDYKNVLVGTKEEEDFWKSCVTDTNAVMNFAVGAMFVRETFRDKSKFVREQAETIINETRDAFKENLNNIDWIDNDTRQAAIEKANAITDMIGFPDFILDPVQLDKEYQDLEIKEDEFFYNAIRVIQFNYKKNIAMLGQPVNKTRWEMAPLAVNAFYTPTKNQIAFPAGILRPPFYSMRHTSSINYGAIGMVMGHELTHAFDDQGREYDLNGNLHQWWNNATIERFKNRTECFVKQYSAYEMDGMKLHGKNILGENIADNGGLKAAYHAYLKSQKDEEDAPLPGLNLTQKQLFFLSFAQVWCSSSTVESMKLQIEKDEHSPSRIRVIGPIRNSPEFAEVFNCSVGSPMNPKDKCVVW